MLELPFQARNSPSSSELRIDVYHDWESALSLKEDWNGLITETRNHNIFLTWEWVTTWWKWFGKEGELHLVVASDAMGLVAIAPLYIGRISVVPGVQVPALCFIGNGGPVYPDYLSPIIREDDIKRCVDAIVASIRTTERPWKLLYMPDVLIDSPTMRALAGSLSGYFRTEMSEGVRCPYQPLPVSYEAFISGLSSRRRESARRYLRKARKQHRVRLECHSTSAAVNDAFSVVSDIYKRSLRGKTQKTAFSRPEYLGFHRDVARVFAEQGWLRLYILWLDDTPVSFVYGYLYGEVYWYYQTAFDLAYGNLGAGSVMLQLVIESVINQGAKEFDFLRGEEEYKYHFAKHERCTKTVTVFRNHGLIHAAMRARSVFSRLLRRF